MIMERLSSRGAGIMTSLCERSEDFGGTVPTAARPGRRRITDRGLNAMAEGIILQSLEDLWRPEERQTSISFFAGEGFRICAEAAGMNVPQQLLLLRLIERAGFRLDPVLGHANA